LNGLQNKARTYALKLLSYRGRSEQELRERLKKKGFSQIEAIATIRDLKQSGLVDDANLAETLKWEAFTAKMLSTEGAKRYVLGRGIPRDIAETAFACNEERDKENAKRLVDKKLRVLKNYPFATARRRMYNLLARKGYSSGLIVELLKEKNLYKEDGS
jgi:regulatory protein